MRPVPVAIDLRALGLYLLLAIVVIGSGCGERKLSPLPPGATVLAFGDSLTDGVGAEGGEDYPAVLAELTGWNVIEAGVPGETTAEGLRRLPGLLAEHEPQLLILLEGGNDILRNQTARTRDNLAEMIGMATARGIPVLLIAVPEKKLLSSAAPWYRELAASHDVIYEGELIGRLMRDAQYKSDPIHFNAAGYRVMAAEIRDLLAENGAL